jgi:serpin B
MQNINPNLKFHEEDIKIFKDLKVSILGAKQKTFFKIDEEGAEAAAVTDIMGFTDYYVPEHIDFRLDRPFFYAIVESNTQCPLFIGYYGN